MRRSISLSALAAGVLSAASWAACPNPQPPQFFVYQSDAATVEVVVADSSLAGADHWAVVRTQIDSGATTTLLPQRIAPATGSITDQGQQLLQGQTYKYTATVTDVSNQATSYDAAAYDVGNSYVGNRHNTPLNTVKVTLGTQYGFDPRPGHEGERLNWDTGFPAPIGPTYAKYFGSARKPSTNVALVCATVTVKKAGTDELATLWADRYGNFRKPNPLTTDRHGAFEFYTANGTYDIQIVPDSGPQFTLTGVTIFDARAPQALVSNDAAALMLVTSDEKAKPNGNIHLKFEKPLASPGEVFNNPGDSFYRLLANQDPYGLALTYNMGVDEQNGGAVTVDHDARPAFFFRINRPAQAMEFAIDPAYGDVDGGPWTWTSPGTLHPVKLETLLHVGPDRAHLKSTVAPIGIQATASEAEITSGRVVAFQDDGTVKLTTAPGQLHPFVVLGVDEPNGRTVVGSSVFLAVGGRAPGWVRGAFSLGDPLISTEDGNAKPAPSETDGRYVVGYVQAQGGAADALNFVAIQAR